MTVHKCWLIDEIITDGVISHRQSVATYEENEDKSWQWIRPDDRLVSDAAKAKWDEVMLALSDVNGVDLRGVTCGIGLMDHCNATLNIDEYSPE